MGNLSTPKSVQKLQAALHAKAKAEAGYRFYALYDKISREDILAHAYAQCRSNKGAQIGLRRPIRPYARCKSTTRSGPALFLPLKQGHPSRATQMVGSTGSASRRPTALNPAPAQSRWSCLTAGSRSQSTAAKPSTRSSPRRSRRNNGRRDRSLLPESKPVFIGPKPAPGIHFSVAA